MRFRLIGAIACLIAPGLASSQGTEAGKDVFHAKCLACHAISCNRVGPKLGGIIGRKVGSLPDFEGYSAEMKSAEFVWSDEKLDEFLADPTGTIPGTLMAFAGKLENPSDRRNLIEFLKTGDTSLDLCF
ncbi:MAG: c-type cytochrome [Gammaproteobacteria bacterium]|nr:c-type cytochrome [Gammaproteobacteria bacterium]NIO23714.1 c-type cytochrome [Gammaproteobacteria bacterium]NIO64330.1 c-type cytochrome [Gammaproteobacteria bacterium]NIP46148.1 c-type cytochrome [Gammaproteobacteria bacterium]NIP63212.1 c-type cytochrome [Gammaproteobacteria bacterium]